MDTTSRQPTPLEIALVGEVSRSCSGSSPCPMTSLTPTPRSRCSKTLQGCWGTSPRRISRSSFGRRRISPERPAYGLDPAAIEGMLVGLNLMEASGQWDDAHRKDPPQPPPLPPDLDDRVASIQSAPTLHEPQSGRTGRVTFNDPDRGPDLAGSEGSALGHSPSRRANRSSPSGPDPWTAARPDGPTTSCSRYGQPSVNAGSGAHSSPSALDQTDAGV